MSFVLLGTTSLFLVLNWRAYRDVLYPPLLLSATWTVVAVVAVAHDKLLGISSVAFLSVVLDLTIFTAIGLLLPRSGKGPRVTARSVEWLVPAVWVGIVASGAALPVFLTRLAQAAGTVATTSAYIAFRWTVNYGPQLGWPVRFVPLAEVTVALASVALSHSPRNRRARFALLVALAIAVAYILPTGARSALFRVFLLAAIPQLVAQPGRRVRILSALIALTAATFIAVGYSLRKIGTSLVDSLATSVYAPLVAYGVAPQLAGIDANATVSLRFFSSVASELGFRVTSISTILPYTYVPNPTNIYTAFYPYVHDAGILGLAAALALLALTHLSVYWNVARYRTPGMVVLLAVLTYALLMQPMVDQYFSLLSQWLQFLLWYVALKEIGRLLRPSTPRQTLTLDLTPAE